MAGGDNGFTIRVVGERVVAAQLSAAAAAVAPKVRRVVNHHGQMLLTRIKANASGRPGPNAPTGDYRRSWSKRLTSSGDTIAAQVGTNAPQGRRLEFGFHGVDSLGRSYNQPPYPHVGPAVDATLAGFGVDLARIVEDL